MKATLLVGTLCLAPLALTAPLSHVSNVVGEKSSWRAAHQPQQQAVVLHVEDTQHVVVSEQSSLAHAGPSAGRAVSERPMTPKGTPKGLPDLSKSQTTTRPSQDIQPAKAKPTKGRNKVFVGTLVVSKGADVFAKLFDPESTPYIITGQFVVKQRADLFIACMILACALVVIAMESWELVTSFISSSCGREGAIRLGGSSKYLDLERYDDDDSGSEDDSDAPFGGYKHCTRSLRLPVKVDEKAVVV